MEWCVCVCVFLSLSCLPTADFLTRRSFSSGGFCAIFELTDSFKIHQMQEEIILQCPSLETLFFFFCSLKGIVSVT